MGEIKFLRFTLNQRIQHIVMIISFIPLVITGMPVKFPDAWWSPIIIDLVGGFEMRTQIHHVSGIIMCILGAYHIVYVGYYLQKTRDLSMLPAPKDITDFIQLLKYYFGLSKEPPKYGKFSWKEKFDYWGAYWGMVIMCFSGIVLLYPFLAMKYIPLAYVQLALLVHTDEALLAALAIFIWHFWNVHLNPDVFPISTHFLTGTLSEEKMKHEHPLEYEEIMSGKETETKVIKTE